MRRRCEEWFSSLIQMDNFICVPQFSTFWSGYRICGEFFFPFYQHRRHYFGRFRGFVWTNPVNEPCPEHVNSHLFLKHESRKIHACAILCGQLATNTGTNRIDFGIRRGAQVRLSQYTVDNLPLKSKMYNEWVYEWNGNYDTAKTTNTKEKIRGY